MDFEVTGALQERYFVTFSEETVAPQSFSEVTLFFAALQVALLQP